ncbi:Fis family transcriptional regulator [Clostridium sp. MF28]|uniref:Transcription antiterminator BglG n=2 Tax=Clostridiaceae TaxID=31979 RepID=A0AAV3VXC4_9CLOT|nr:sigma-54-dependent transcriptional regulator [Clostridium diolis]AVK49986.1 Fis family transcriptional regulator [Clostridium sp. MF28]PSM59774.1 sigma-54-dependent transcriptional regulator [Clostridium diolis]QES72201.1 AAA family ATPase [Clostridium diolis]GEA30180.1 transcription antiterminator BglG [Clostridium diolis]
MLLDYIMGYLEEQTCYFGRAGDNSRFTASEIAKKFDVKRNTVSHYLNQMVDEGKIIKINTRPVYFLHYSQFEKCFFGIKGNKYNSIEELFFQKPLDEEKDKFSELIGFKGSLEKALEQIKTSIFYPNNGLPIILSGPTGVGKSLLAKYIYNYSVEKQVISKDSPFIVFNCAQYYNNPELLSANLFGYIKGAFTGAESVKEGMLKEADGGILFLDEVHRLNEEGQEKLFTFMDQGVFRRMGESSGWHKANVRLVFATTESLSENFLRTFLRRIPISVSIPDLDKRGTDEKLQFIYQFLIKEAKILNKKISISNRAIDLMLNYNFKGNIGELQNTVKYVCAKSYTKKINSEMIQLGVLDFPEELLEDSIKKSDIKIKQSEYILILPDTTIPMILKKDGNWQQLIKNTYIQIMSFFNDIQKKNVSIEYFETNVFQEVYALFDKLIFERKEENKNVMIQYITASIQEIFRYMEINYNIKFNGNSVYAISYFLYIKSEDSLEWNEEQRKLRDSLYNYILKNNKLEHEIAIKLIKLIESKMDIKFTIDDKIFLSFYLKSLNIQQSNNGTKTVILAHGYATASSIANVANRMLEMNMFEAFDMPIDIKMDEIAKKLINFIEENDVSKGLVILVDMGSLNDIYESINSYINGPVVIINNVSTQMALFVGEMLKNKIYLEELVENLKEHNETSYKILYPEENKKKVIVTSCFTGMGTALQLQKLLQDSIPEKLKIKVIAHDYERLKTFGMNEALFQLYDVLTIVGTADPEIKHINYISLEDLMSGRGENQLRRILQKIADENDLKTINDNIVHNFTLRRVIDTLTILDTDKLLRNIEECLDNLEIAMKKKLNNEKKIALLVHISCLVERLIRHEEIDVYPNLENFIECQKDMIKTIENSFSVIEKIYNVKINLPEIGFIYDILMYQSTENTEF